MPGRARSCANEGDRKSTRLNSSHANMSYAVFCLKKKRLDGYEIRTPAVAASIPCITTVQAMAAAVQCIEALRRGDIGVRSLQEVHAGFFFNDTATTEIYTLSLHDALPI